MTPEERELLNRVAKTVDENNEMLHKIRSSMRWASVMRWVYWIFIIGSAVGAFWLIQPYLNSLTNAYTGTQNSTANLQDMIKQYTQ
jgi:hypothetical protein